MLHEELSKHEELHNHEELRNLLANTDHLVPEITKANALPDILPRRLSTTSTITPLTASEECSYEESVQPFLGRWQVNIKVSDPIDEILKNLGVGMMKRMAVRKWTAITQFELVAKDALRQTTHLPLGLKKESLVRLNGGWFDRPDADTGEIWRNETFFDQQSQMLIQVRRSEPMGTLYDIRVIYENGEATGVEGLQDVTTPVMLFRWTSVQGGRTVHANRWLVKL